MTDRLDPIHKPEVAEVRTVGEKRYRLHGKYHLPAGMKLWSIDKAGDIREVVFNKAVALNMEGKVMHATWGTLDKENYRYCPAINRKNAEKKFNKLAQLRGPM